MKKPFYARFGIGVYLRMLNFEQFLANVLKVD